ncbi:type II secretion system protein GspK, partial [Rhodoplanes sp. SY1]
MELTAYHLLSAPSSQRAPRGSFHVRLAGASVDVGYVSEAARISLNAAPKPMIAGLFAVLGAPRDSAEVFASRIVRWRTPAKLTAVGIEETNEEDLLYRSAGLPYLPRYDGFNDIDELRLVVGLPAALVEQAMRFLTVYSELPDVNVLIAPAEAIAALPGMTPARLTAFLDARESVTPGSGPDLKFVLDALGDQRTGVTTGLSDAYRVRTLIVFDDGRRTTAELVLRLASADSP